MSMGILERLRAEIAGNTELNTLFADRYKKSATAFVGYKKSPSISQLPCLCFVPIVRAYEDNTANMRHGDRAASILISINEPTEADGIFDGVRYMEQIIDLIIDIIRSQPFPEVIFKKMRVVSDKGLRHPLYESEIVFSYLEIT